MEREAPGRLLAVVDPSAVIGATGPRLERRHTAFGFQPPRRHRTRPLSPPMRSVVEARERVGARQSNNAPDALCPQILGRDWSAVANLEGATGGVLLPLRRLAWHWQSLCDPGAGRRSETGLCPRPGAIKTSRFSTRDSV